MSLENTEWVKWSEAKPMPKVVCDFLYDVDDVIPHVWILCSAVPAATARYKRQPSYWRLAKPFVWWVADDLPVGAVSA